MQRLKGALIIGAAYLIGAILLETTALSAEEQNTTQVVPASCKQLDEQLDAQGALGSFLIHGFKKTKDADEKLAPAEACVQIKKTSAYIGGMLGISSYCDTQSVLLAGATSSPIYKRLVTVLRSMSNDLHAIASRKGC